jgi:cytochrome P450
MSTSNHDFEHFSIYDQDTAQNAREIFAAARQHCPVISTDADEGYSVITRYDDVKEALGSPELFSSAWGAPRGKMEPPIVVDPPLHRHYRLLLNRFLSYRALEPYVDRMREIANVQIDRWVDRGEVDFIREFADPFTATVLAEIIFNDTDAAWTRLIQEGLKDAGTDGSTHWLEIAREFANKKMEERIASGKDEDDILNAIINGKIDGRPLTQEEREGTLMTLFGGGLDTTKAALSGIMIHVARAPQLEEKIRHIGWKDNAIDEFVREISPVSYFGRIATQDVPIGDENFAAGTRFLISFFSANHDESEFSDPNTIDFDRDHRRSLGFGYGIHRCIGVQLAKLQIGVGIQEVFKRITNVRLQQDEIIQSVGLPRFPLSVPLSFDQV